LSLWWTRCLIRPSGERSNGISSALTTLGRVSYSLRNASEAATSSARKLQVLSPTWAKSRSSRFFVIAIPPTGSKVFRRAEAFRAGRQFVRRIGHDFLEQQVHEQEQRFRLEHQQDRLVLGIIVEVLMHAAVLDDHDVAGLPVDAAAVVDVVAAALDHVKTC